jgi:tRNA wybutosine-synthesizing protein 3
MENFQLWKKNTLSKIDKSSIGSIDEKIKLLCDKINSQNELFTLSSCSGRICILEKENKEKVESVWKYVSHKKSNKNEVWKIVNGHKGKPLEFRQEGPILHICCHNLKVARDIMHKAKLSGFNQVGIIGAKNKIVVELICDIIITMPIFDEKLLITQDYLEYIIEKANNNLELGWKCIDKFQKNL